MDYFTRILDFTREWKENALNSGETYQMVKIKKGVIASMLPSQKVTFKMSDVSYATPISFVDFNTEWVNITSIKDIPFDWAKFEWDLPPEFEKDFSLFYAVDVQLFNCERKLETGGARLSEAGEPLCRYRGLFSNTIGSLRRLEQNKLAGYDSISLMVPHCFLIGGMIHTGS
jgi:hypothetical protein